MRNEQFTTFYGVWTAPRADDPRTLRPMRKTYTSLKKAERVAKQMSVKHGGKKFFVMEAVMRVEGVEPNAALLDAHLALHAQLAQAEEREKVLREATAPAGDLFRRGEVLYANWPSSPIHGQQVTFRLYGPGSRDCDADVMLADGRRVSVPSEILTRQRPVPAEEATAQEAHND